MEALRKLDQQFGRIARARRYAPRPYEIVVLSDHGQTQGATFKQRHGYGLDELVERSLARGRWRASPAATSSTRWCEHAVEEATGRKAEQAPEERRLGPRGRGARLRQPRARLPDGGASAGSRSRRSTSAIPTLIPRAARPPARRLAARALGRARRRRARAVRRPRTSTTGRVEGDDPLARLLADRGPPPPAHRRLRPRGGHHGRQLLRPGARRGLRVRGADLVPRRARRPADPAVHPRAAGAPAAGRAHHRRRRGPRAAARAGGARLAGRPHARRTSRLSRRRAARSSRPARRRSERHETPSLR